MCDSVHAILPKEMPVKIAPRSKNAQPFWLGVAVKT
jgi:hypothetical protein